MRELSNIKYITTPHPHPWWSLCHCRSPLLTHWGYCSLALNPRFTGMEKFSVLQLFVVGIHESPQKDPWRCSWKFSLLSVQNKLLNIELGGQWLGTPWHPCNVNVTLIGAHTFVFFELLSGGLWFHHWLSANTGSWFQIKGTQVVLFWQNQDLI